MNTTAHANYALIAYKSDGFSTCMGHVNETWSSDFKMFTGLLMDDCLRIHAEVKRTQYSEDEPQWEMNVLYRGIPIAEAGAAIYELYCAALEQEVEDQNEKAAAQAALELQRRERESAERATQQQEARVQKLMQTADELGFTVTPK